MPHADGNGWVRCTCGATHWGRYGAAGLLLWRGEEPGGRSVLLQLRAAWTHEGGTWGVLGGARDSHEDVVVAALREAAEEGAVDAEHVEVVGTEVGVDHGAWSYTYVLGRYRADRWSTDSVGGVRAANTESDEVAWIGLDQVESLPMHRAFATAWPRLRERLTRAGADPG